MRWRASSSKSSDIWPVISVGTAGDSAFTRTPNGPSSLAAAFVTPTSLGSAVGNLPDASAGASPRDHVDDRAAALLSHGLGGLPQRDECPGEVHIENPLPALVGRIGDEVVERDRSVVHQHVESSESVHGAGNHCRGLLCVAKVTWFGMRTELRRNGLNVVQSSAVHHHLSTFGGEPRGDPTADTAGGTGNDDDLSVEFTHPCAPQ